MLCAPRFLSAALAAIAHALVGASGAAVLPVGAFTGVHVADGITVHSNVSADGNASVSLEASAEVLPQVNSFLDPSGTLLLFMVPGTSGSGVVARVSVPGPLLYAGASAGGQLIADSASGTLTTSSGGHVIVENLEASEPLSIIASSVSEIVVSGGIVGSVTVSCSSISAMRLGRLRADSAVISASDHASVSGLTAGIVKVTAGHGSSVSLAASRSVSLWCSHAEVILLGAAKLTTLYSAQCQLALAGGGSELAASAATSKAVAVGPFTGVHANDGIVVHSNASADGNASLSVEASLELLPQVRTFVDGSGTLILSMAPGTSGSGVSARVSVPRPLSYAGASTGGRLTAHSVSGNMAASSDGHLDVEALAASQPLSVTASSSSGISVSGGVVGFVSVSCSGHSAVRFGRLQADSAVISASAKSKISGLTVGAAQVTAASESSISLRASHRVSLSCSSSDVIVLGPAVLTTHFESQCRIALPAGELAASSAPSKALSVGLFTGVHVSGGIVVHSNVSADGKASMSIDAGLELLPRVRSFVDGAGTLILSLAPGAGSSNVTARVSVPGPLSYAGASAGGQLFADAVSGTMAASSGGRLMVQSFTTSQPVSATASSGSEVIINEGIVGFLLLSCSSLSAMSLGQLQAESAVISVSARSRISGMTVGTAEVTAASASSISVTATREAFLSCSSSEVRIQGAAAVTTRSETACRVDRTGLPATLAFYP